jgi:hypothetical protein
LLFLALGSISVKPNAKYVVSNSTDERFDAHLCAKGSSLFGSELPPASHVGVYTTKGYSQHAIPVVTCLSAKQSHSGLLCFTQVFVVRCCVRTVSVFATQARCTPMGRNSTSCGSIRVRLDHDSGRLAELSECVSQTTV